MDDKGKPVLDAKNNPTLTKETKYNALSVGAEDGRLRLDPAPYTLIEGFLQLAAPLVAPTIPDGNATVNQLVAGSGKPAASGGS